VPPLFIENKDTILSKPITSLHAYYKLKLLSFSWTKGRIQLHT
jgi:hypothetical protein